MRTGITIAIIVFIRMACHAQNDSVLYSFFVAGHTYGKPGVNNAGFHPPFKKKFDYIQSRPEIQFGVLTGDIVSANPVAQDWDEIDADIDTLGIPVYFAVGNHDMENRTLFESRYGNTYYYFMYQNDLFIFLDPNIDEWNISGEQMQYLKNVINDYASISERIYVFFHEILWREDDNQFSYIQWNSDIGRGDSINFWTEVEPLFNHLPNEVIMFAGDLGASWSSDVTYDHYDNMTLIASGMGDEDGENFIVVNVDTNKSVSYDLICLSDTNIDCLGKLSDHLVVDEITGNNELIGKNMPGILLYPNPASSYITLSNNANSNTTIQVFKIDGGLMLEEKYAEKSKHTIDVRHYPRGIYAVRIFNDLIPSTIKLIIE